MPPTLLSCIQWCPLLCSLAAPSSIAGNQCMPANKAWFQSSNMCRANANFSHNSAKRRHKKWKLVHNPTLQQSWEVRTIPTLQPKKKWELVRNPHELLNPQWQKSLCGVCVCVCACVRLKRDLVFSLTVIFEYYLWIFWFCNCLSWFHTFIRYNTYYYYYYILGWLAGQASGDPAKKSPYPDGGTELIAMYNNNSNLLWICKRATKKCNVFFECEPNFNWTLRDNCSWDQCFSFTLLCLCNPLLLLLLCTLPRQWRRFGQIAMQWTSNSSHIDSSKYNT